MSYSLVVTGIAAAAVVIAYLALKRARAQKLRADAAEATVRQREHIIRAMQEVSREAEEKKRALRTGDAGDRFDAAVDVLRDAAGDAPSKPRP